MDNIASLVCHPDTPAGAVKAIRVSGDRGHSGFVTLRYEVSGDIGRLAIPAPQPPARADGLWNATCFELFTRDEDDTAYREFNFSPCGRWAAYGFSGYRDGMTAAHVMAPRIAATVGDRLLTVDVTFVSPRLGPQMVGASAVIEELDGTKSYWALVHPSGKPDFHHPVCFAYILPPPRRPS